MNKDIAELIEYLKEVANESALAGGVVHEQQLKIKKWAEAVENLQSDFEICQVVADKHLSTIEAYERILDKGITVNVYQDSVIPKVVKHEIEKFHPWNCDCNECSEIKDRSAS